MAVADTNVRPRRQATAVTARGVRRLQLARLLLQLLELLQLDRKLSLLFAASLMPACIIPVGPNWQDPPGDRNHTPELVSFMPPVGAIVTTTRFRVVFNDPNGDDLVAKWIVDGPPFTPEQSFVSPVMRPMQGAFEFDALCPFMVRPGRTTHQIMVAVTDGEFKPGTDPLATVDGRVAVRLGWTLELSCSAQ
jgi:hypothetical protein